MEDLDGGYGVSSGSVGGGGDDCCIYSNSPGNGFVAGDADDDGLHCYTDCCDYSGTHSNPSYLNRRNCHVWEAVALSVC